MRRFFSHPIHPWRALSMPLIALITLGALQGCGKSTPQTAITGVIQHPDATELPAGAQLVLRLTDVTGTDGAAVTVAETPATAVARLPYHYRLPFDAARIDAKHRYTVDARITVAGQLRYATDRPFAVLTEGHGREADIMLITAGAASVSPDSGSSAAEELFRGELRGAAEVTLYVAGFRNGALQWLKEDHAAGSQPLQASYQFKGGYLLRYSDSTGVTLEFNEQGKPTAARRQQQPIALSAAQPLISAARTRAALLRSHALASRDTRQHRLETEQGQSAAP